MINEGNMTKEAIEIISAIGMMGGLGILIGIGLAAASKIFYVYVDPKIVAVDEALPGANCGGCGLPGCTANAEAIVAGKAAPNSCVAAGDDVAEEIAAILGVTIEAKEPDIALPGCYYGTHDADLKYFYDGLNDCRAAALLSGGMKVCSIGCIGLGTCVRACPFDALAMGKDGLPVVNENRCTGCGNCERVCPNHIITLSSVTRRIMKEYTKEDCTTPCQRSCPAGIDISEYIRQIAMGDYHRAVQVIKERNPFPTVIGRICPRPCETDCRRQLIDEPVAINSLKRFVADYEKARNHRVLPSKAPDTGRSIAVIGGGVEGLSTAFFSARLGHQATVFESAARPGGLLRNAIAKSRLPHDILDWDIQGIVEMGVTIEPNKPIGREISVSSLLERGFEAVFVATGGWDSRQSQPSESEMTSPVPGTYLLIDLIKESETLKGMVSDVSDVVIAGGGGSAVAGAGICKRLGAKKVTIVNREPREESPLSEEDMQRLEKDGVDLFFNTAVGRLLGEGNELSAIETVALDSMDVKAIPAKLFIIAAGRYPDLIFVRESTDDDSGDENSDSKPAGQPMRWEAIEPYKKPANFDGIGLFAKGEALSDFSAAIEAIGAGRRAAASIHKKMYHFDLNLPEHVVTPRSYLQNVDSVNGVKTSARLIMPVNHQAASTEDSEVEMGFTEAMARSEAERCLQCGLICYKKTVEN
jgi:NADPH-dependent glutamate synthase beta subunit-like oxidoreductase